MPDPSPLPKGELFIIGLGPGARGLLAPDAHAALEFSDIIAGYSGYIDLVDPVLLQGKTIIATGMRGEVDRCEKTLAAVQYGAKACLVCSGDPGVYAMAGLILEMLHARNLTLATMPITIVPGIPAVCAAAALLGAPLTHDFACVSLSDLLTPRETIVTRLEHAFAADFTVALYNPRSQKRRDNLAEALTIATKYRAPKTPIGHVRNAYRPDQHVSLTTLSTFNPEDADMFSIILVGNSTATLLPGENNATDWADGARMYTPRGYCGKYRLK